MAIGAGGFMLVRALVARVLQRKIVVDMGCGCGMLKVSDISFES